MCSFDIIATMSHPIMMALLLFYVGLICVYADPGGFDFEAMRQEVAKKLAVLRKLEAQDLTKAKVEPPMVNYDKKEENLFVSDANRKPETLEPKWKSRVANSYSDIATITKVNENFTDFLYDGDIFLMPEKLDEMIAERSGKVQKRQIYPQYGSWNKHEIPYFFDRSFHPAYFSIVRWAFAEYERLTCLRFKEISGYPYVIPPGQTYLQIVSSFGCFSNSIGRDANQHHIISLGSGCINQRTILHEIGHALGFIHTHNRPDREKYVTVYSNNANISYQDQFDMIKDYSYDNMYPYDYMSIMHYHDTAFSPDDKFITIQANNLIYQKIMGRDPNLSFLDISMLNNYYQCDDQCTTQLACQYGGYRTSGSCDRCFCPSGFGGPTCEIRAGSDRQDDCGDTLKATSKWRTISSGGAENCTWYIVASENKQVEVKFTKLKGFHYSGYKCSMGVVEVKLDHPFVKGFKACPGYRQVEMDTYVSKYRTAVINKWNVGYPLLFQLQYREIDS
uniref:Zinc metalloproteinase n=1 Tax=Panagrellus redivivus TaxID=6233 RepID=A0A7E4V3K9_PANRE